MALFKETVDDGSMSQSVRGVDDGEAGALDLASGPCLFKLDLL